ncbi:unnamed protein product [Gordionus sp. m RMFG-2023]
MEVKDEDREDYTRLGIWMADSRCYRIPTSIRKTRDLAINNELNQNVLPKLLINALSSKNFLDSLVIIMVSISQPWTLIQSLNKWLGLVKDHIDKNLISNSKNTKANLHLTNMPKNKKNVGEHNEFLSNDLDIPFITHQKYEIYKEIMIKKFLAYSEREEPKQPNIDKDNISTDSQLLSLLLQDENILSNNLGIPLLIVVTKTDVMNELGKEYDFRNEHFDFIQQHIRKICLTYGAGLIYTSFKENKNCDLLRQYILHLMYSFPFKKGPMIIDNDSIFIPIGWDSTKKIAILNEGLINIMPDANFEDILGSPPFKKADNKEPDILAEDEQVFLSHMQNLLSQPLKNRNEMLSNRTSSIVVQKNAPRSSPYHQSPNQIFKDKSIKNYTDSPNSMNQPQNSNTSSILINTSTHNTSIGLGGQSTESNSERVLTVFFNSLLNKGKTSTSSLNSQLINNPLLNNSTIASTNSNIGLDDSNQNLSKSDFDTNSEDTNSEITLNNDSKNPIDINEQNMSLNEMAEHLNRVSASTPLKSDMHIDDKQNMSENQSSFIVNQNQ